MACKTISNLIHSSTTAKLSTTAAVAPVKIDSSSSSSNNNNHHNQDNDNNLRDNSMKRLDQISKNVLQNALRFTGRLRVVEAPRGGIDSNGEEE
eukprot:scaffold28413_cov94-Skeletonema_dohrnii-CCMP3373.AAC.1